MDQDLINKITDMVTTMVLERVRSEEYELKIPVGVSARHVHLTREDLDILFGNGYELKRKKELMGGQFASEEVVTIAGSRLSTIEGVRILGPLRSKTQVEISKTDAVKLGLDPPVRESGNIEKSETITIVGPKGALHIKEGCIIAKRHIHMKPEDAIKFNVHDNERVSVKVPGDRGGVLENVQIRIDKSFSLEMHIDTDESNAFGIKCGNLVEILKSSQL